MRLKNSQPALECLRDSPLLLVARGLLPTPNSEYMVTLRPPKFPHCVWELRMSAER